MKGVQGKFGFKEEQFFHLLLDKMKWGGKDKQKFEIHLKESTVELYLDVADVNGLIKIDSGPRCKCN